MWPWYPWWLWMMPPDVPNRDECRSNQRRVEAAAEALDEQSRAHEEGTREVRHGSRNIRFLMQSLLHRLERRNEA